MAEDTAVIEDNIQDVSILEPLETSLAEPASEPAKPAEDEGAETEEQTPAEEESQTDANGNEAKEATAAKAEENQPADEGSKTPEAQANQPDPNKAARAFQERRERQRTEQQIAQQLDQFYGPRTEEDLINEGVDPAQAQIQALREEMAYKDQRTYVAELNAGMRAEAVEVVNDFSVFNPNSPDFDPEFTSMVENQYKTAARLQFDANNIITNAEVPLYDFYQNAAQIYGRGASKGNQSGKQETIQMLSRTEDVGGSSSTSKGPETLDEMEDRLGDMPLV